ncbi:replication-associated protein [Avon-Heathcote Estuary associated circular virus 3]|uniref:replication-associated protein n=1 Tax=Avon-Heathcote Estuary associated circular virus 3 TaxID=1618254 RepID=UPI0005CDB3DB|nr:replication-associated protein [Avon-Heathcote Estuary associated circular virus 3]AJP36341.1 replication-associated protein [Avon-Heathcote Estuary associated circular virus 3]
MNQARFWILTIRHADFLPYLPPTVDYLRGQLERGDGGFLHWQLVVHFARKVRLGGVKGIFGDSTHAEPTRSDAAREYVWKEDSAVPNTRFELGKIPVRRGVSHDWDAVRESAKRGRLDDIPADIYCRLYGNFKRIAVDHMVPLGIEREVNVYWGVTGSGKSRRAWNEAGLDAFPKDPRTKFWDGYRGHENVVIDEFRGGIDVAHLLRWFDRYPVVVEVKGSSVVLSAKHIWITSNLDPREWYADLDAETLAALLRRLKITQFAI